ncbi:MAG: hypothetical protein MUF20_06535 [Methylotetracoccus sp.]|nr:hypothetical protein [Methylotetracoccus sp.]
MRRKPPASVMLCTMLALSSGCTLVKGTLMLPDLAIQALLPFSQRKPPPDAVEVQAQLIRFSDHYLEAVTRNMRKIQRGGEPISRRELVRRRIQYTNEVLAIATGSNAFANLLDMIVLVTLTRMRVENYMRTQARRVDLGPIAKVFQDAEREVWRISAVALSPEQQAELRATLHQWLKRNPHARMTPDLADLDFVADIKQFSRARASSAPASVFNLLMIDPLSGLDPAAKELAETRLMAERALFLSRHLPELIRWETEYLAMNTLEVPEVARLLSDTTKLSESADRFSQVAQTLPQLVSSEREQLVMTLKSERQGLTALAAESKQALTAGKQMADSANATLKSFQAVMAQLEAKPSDPNAEPFRISDYTAAAAQISQTSERLAELLDLFNRTIGPDNVDALSTRVDGLSRQVESRSRDVVDYAYRKALIGSALICAMGLGTALAYQLLSAWLQRINASRMPLRRREPAD